MAFLRNVLAKSARLPRSFVPLNKNLFKGLNVRCLTTYPIDDIIFGLSDEQRQV
jgi:hypothetical protein